MDITNSLYSHIYIIHKIIQFK